MELHLKWVTAFWLSCLLALTSQADDFVSQKEIKFSTKKIAVNGKKITVELAETDEQHQRGLMMRTKLPKDQGMLFAFKDEQIRSFWMKNTLINLSIGYYDKNKTLIDIQEMKAQASVMQQNLPTYPSAKPAMYALEMVEGWFKKNKILIGSTFSFVK